MTQPQPAPLKLAVLGLDARGINLFRMFLNGPGKNQAQIVHDIDAEAFLIDVDGFDGERLFSQQRKSRPGVPMIVLALKQQSLDGDTIFVPKPAQIQSMVHAIDKARAMVADRQKLQSEPSSHNPTHDMKRVTANEDGNGSVYKAAMQMDENSFKSYLGFQENIDPSDPAKASGIFYEPKEYLQGYVQTACNLAIATQQAICMATPWKSITILPKQRKVYLDADEAQLRAACSIPFRRITSLEVGNDFDPATANVRELEAQEVSYILEQEHIASIDTFLWKVALWSSKGKIPRGIELNTPVRLKRWPNFTRLLVTPHAMRIAAILHKQPHNLFDVARLLDVRQQYVLAFFSAAYAQGLMELHPVIVDHDLPHHEPVIQPQNQNPRSSILKKILQRLRIV